MLQQARRERPSRKQIRQPHVGGRARKNRSSSPSTTAELIPATTQAERAIANVLRRTATRVPNPEPDQAAPATRVRKAQNRGLCRLASGEPRKCCEFETVIWSLTTQ